MTPSEILAKDYSENHLARQGVMDIWRREWKASLVVPLKEAHASYVAIQSALSARIKAGVKPNGSGPIEREWVDTIAALEKVEKCLCSSEERMKSLFLHPTRPAAKGEAKGGKGSRPSDTAEPIEAVQVEIPMPRPEVDVARGTRETL